MNKNPQNLKTVLYPENFFETPDSVFKSNCLNVMDYKYRCYRERDEFNNPYGSFLTENLVFTVKVSSLNDCASFYKLMGDNRSHVFSIIFDPVFNVYQRMTNFKDGMLVDGYVVDILESCQYDDETGDEQLEVSIVLALNKISYLGMENLQNLNITND